jgi:hypothetical protein
MRGRPWIGALLVLGCRTGTDPLAELAVHASVEPVVVRAGAPVTVRVTIINPTRRTVLIPGRSCPPFFEVRTISGGLVGPHSPSCILLLPPPISLAPGEQHSIAQQWNGSGRGTDDGVRLPQGEYRLIGFLYACCGGPRSEPVTVLVD